MPVVHVSGLRALDGDPRWTGAIEALLDAVDTYVPMPVRCTDAPFLLPVENVLTITGRNPLDPARRAAAARTGRGQAADVARVWSS